MAYPKQLMFLELGAYSVTHIQYCFACRSTASKMAAVVILTSLMHRLYVMTKVRLWEMVPIPFYGPNSGDVQTRMHYMWSASYLSLISHATPLSLGILTYMALTSIAVNNAISR